MAILDIYFNLKYYIYELYIQYSSTVCVLLPHMISCLWIWQSKIRKEVQYYI